MLLSGRKYPFRQPKKNKIAPKWVFEPNFSVLGPNFFRYSDRVSPATGGSANAARSRVLVDELPVVRETRSTTLLVADASGCAGGDR